ncbi:MAG: YggS family pyridoxal phosphate-dependent enzyme [Thiogranum sp.]|nr:YggS family pyridoxal phosphate-dependent enzyme [Thiogranum sp.]
MNESAAALEDVRRRMAEAAQRAGRRTDSVRLIAASKTQSIAAVQQLVDCGQTRFGESRMQEALVKIAHFAELGLEWHFIGHLQSKKARLVPGHFSWVHSIDSAGTAGRIGAEAERLDVSVNLLLQVNIADDPAKHGVPESGLFALAETILGQPHAGIRLCGLMTIGRADAQADATRRDFARLRELLEQCRVRFGSDFRELSMGMSGDYEMAIEEGATLVRVGSALFGVRA